jgi:hypothetical protein
MLERGFVLEKPKSQARDLGTKQPQPGFPGVPRAGFWQIVICRSRFGNSALLSGQVGSPDRRSLINTLLLRRSLV